jgi:hypothetical protein
VKFCKVVCRPGLGGSFTACGFISLICARLALATVVSCPTSSPGVSLQTLGTGSLSSGCAEIDKSFTNFLISNATTTAPTASDINIFATGATPVGNTISPVTAFLDTTGSATTWSSTGLFQQETVGFEVTANTGGSFTGGTYPTPATPGAFWAINQLVLNPSVTIIGSSPQNTVSVALSFCVGGTSVSGCSAGNSGTLNAAYDPTTPLGTFLCNFSGCVSPSGNTINLGGAVTQIAVNLTVSLASSTAAGQSTALNNVGLQLGEFAAGASTVPEPYSLLLAGAGLAGIALLRFRRRRR